MDARFNTTTGLSAAVFVDVENMAFAQTGQAFQLERLMSYVQRESNPIVRRAYADWRSVGLYADSFHEYAFDEIQVSPANGQKNGADLHLAIDAVEFVIRMPDLRRFYLVSGDSDYCPLVRLLRRYGREVVMVAWSQSVGELLRAHCDRVVMYEQLLAAPVSRGFADPLVARAVVVPRRPLVRRMAGDQEEAAYDAIVDRLIAEVGAVQNLPLPEVRQRLLRLDPLVSLPTGPAFRAWLELHPRVQVTGDDDDAVVHILPVSQTSAAASLEEQFNQAIAAENLVFLGAQTQGIVIDTLYDMLSARSEPFTRSETLQALRFRLRDQLGEQEPDYDALNSVFHIFYRAHAFQRFAAAGVRNAPLLLKPSFKDRIAFRALHDRYLIQLAIRQGLRWSLETWAEVLGLSEDQQSLIEDVVASYGRAEATTGLMEPVPEDV